MASRQHSHVSSCDVLPTHDTLHRPATDRSNKGAHILERPLHFPHEPPRLLSGKSGRWRAKTENFFLPSSSEVEQWTGLQQDGHKGDACLVHGNTQNFPVPYPVLLTGDANRCGTEHGVEVRSSRIQYKWHIQPRERGDVPGQSPP